MFTLKPNPVKILLCLTSAGMMVIWAVCVCVIIVNSVCRVFCALAVNRSRFFPGGRVDKASKESKAGW